MMILATAWFFNELAERGVIWTGVGAAYLLALLCDVSLLALLICRMT